MRFSKCAMDDLAMSILCYFHVFNHFISVNCERDCKTEIAKM